MRPGAGLCVILVLNVAVWDFCLAAGGRPGPINTETPGEAVPAADSSAANQAAPNQSASDPAVADPSAPGIVPPAGETGVTRLYDSDLPGSQGGPDLTVPIYRKWWFWSIVGGALVTAMIVGARGEEEAGPDLPNFPGPPER